MTVRRHGGRRVVAVLALLIAFPPHRLTAQCPDGSPPPCQAAAPTQRTPPRDPNRIAILPFRVTTADTLLGEGLAELLASEFSGDDGPRAAHMGTVLRAWRQAGGGPRSPLQQGAAAQVARQVGAARYIEGSVVGLGPRLTLSASIVSVAGGAPHLVGPVSGAADSLEGVLGRLVSGLLGATGGERGPTLQSPLTASPAAMRAYLAGLRAWRLNQQGAAAAAFERALVEDSTFARAAFMRFLVAWWNTSADEEDWQRRVWLLRSRLSPSDQVLLVAYLGEGYPARRSPRQDLADRERAAALLSESPEAQFELGDWLVHTGASADVPDRLERAIAQFHRSLALDTQETVLGHVAWAAVLEGDSVLARSLRGPLQARGAGVWSASWMVAAWLDDASWLEDLYSRGATAEIGVYVAGATAGGARPALIEERLDRGVRPETAHRHRFRSAVVQGRPAAALRAATAAPPSIGRETRVVVAALFADGDSAAAPAAVERLVVWPARDSAEVAAASCPVALWQAKQGRFDPGTLALLRAHGQERCALIMELWRSWSAGRPDVDTLLARADSVVRWNLWGATRFENVLLARVWEDRGNRMRALAASRLRPDGLGEFLTEATGARMEGRLAAMVGDTVAAVRAYRRYLTMRRYAEPALVPQRDSVRAELAALEGNRR